MLAFIIIVHPWNTKKFMRYSGRVSVGRGVADVDIEASWDLPPKSIQKPRTQHSLLVLKGFLYSALPDVFKPLAQ